MEQVSPGRQWYIYVLGSKIQCSLLGLILHTPSKDPFVVQYRNFALSSRITSSPAPIEYKGPMSEKKVRGSPLVSNAVTKRIKIEVSVRHYISKP
jgi:hypothetical protein